MQTLDRYWWDTFGMDMCGMLDMCGICVGYVWNGYVWDMCGMLDMCGICVGYVWNGYVWDMCGVLDMCGICVGYVWNGHVWDMCGVLDMCGIRLEWICVGYVWCAGYVWDMCGVRYANNLLKNPATKRLSENDLQHLEQPLKVVQQSNLRLPAGRACEHNDCLTAPLCCGNQGEVHFMVIKTFLNLKWP